MKHIFERENKNAFKWEWWHQELDCSVKTGNACGFKEGLLVFVGMAQGEACTRDDMS